MDTSLKRKQAPQAPATAEQNASPDAKRRPVHTIRVEDVSCSIWERTVTIQGMPRQFWSCTFERSYKDRNGAWRYTKTFDWDSLGKLVSAAQQASQWITAQQYPQAEV
jgi:hypothetical protein